VEYIDGSTPAPTKEIDGEADGKKVPNPRYKAPF